jgi:hypothetical protein
MYCFSKQLATSHPESMLLYYLQQMIFIFHYSCFFEIFSGILPDNKKPVLFNRNEWLAMYEYTHWHFKNISLCKAAYLSCSREYQHNRTGTASGT